MDAAWEGTLKITSCIEDEFEGTDDEVVYTLDNGQKWQQVEYKYQYHYLYRPNVVIEYSGDTGIMYVSGFSDPIKVRRIK